MAPPTENNADMTKAGKTCSETENRKITLEKSFNTTGSNTKIDTGSLKHWHWIIVPLIDDHWTTDSGLWSQTVSIVLNFSVSSDKRETIVELFLLFSVLLFSAPVSVVLCFCVSVQVFIIKHSWVNNVRHSQTGLRKYLQVILLVLKEP